MELAIDFSQSISTRRHCGAIAKVIATQSRRLLANAEAFRWSATDASRIGGVGLQIIRDLGAALQRPRTGRAGRWEVTGRTLEAPVTAAHWPRLLRPARSRRSTASCAGGARTWRGGSWFSFAISLDETTLGREF